MLKFCTNFQAYSWLKILMAVEIIEKIEIKWPYFFAKGMSTLSTYAIISLLNTEISILKKLYVPKTCAQGFLLDQTWHF